MSTKKPVFNQAECEVAKVVIQRFMKNEEPTTERFLMRELKSLRPQIAEAVRRLSGRSVFNMTNNTVGEELYTPKAVAYHYCGDTAALAFAKKSTETILSVVRNLYERELDAEGNAPNQTPFTREDAEVEAQKIDPSVTPEMIRVGLTLAEEFGVFRTIQRNAQQIGVMKFLPAKRIFELGENAWDEHIRRVGVWLERDADGKTPDQLVPSYYAGWPVEVEAADVEMNKVFVVHGHAEEPKQAVADFLRSVGLEPIILHEQPNQGRTIIEKFEKHSGVVGFAVVLLTPDDIGASAENPTNMRPRARQNVILELGYFMSKLGRGRVCALYVDGVELPSDYQGVLWLPYNDSGAWRNQLAKELTAAGIEVDSEKLQKALSEQPRQTKHSTEPKRTNESVPNLRLDHATAESKVNDPMAERRWNRVRDEISKLPEYNREGLRLLLEFPSLTDYTALQKLGQLAQQNSLASILPGLQNQTGLIRPVPGQPPTRQPEYETHYEIAPELRQFVERYFNQKA